MLVLGFNCYMDDAAAAIFHNGHLLGAVEEERFTRVKHTGVFPEQAIRWCLKEAGAEARDLHAVAFNMRPWKHLHRRLGLIAQGLPQSLAVWGNQGQKWSKMMAVQETFRRTFAPGSLLPPYRFFWYEHHWTHAASAFFPSPFEEAAVVTWDGSGEWPCLWAGVGRGMRLERLWEQSFPHSLGYLYSAVTQFLGFKVHSGEGKVMGLASYGDERFFKDMARLVRLLPGGRFELNLEFFNFYKGGPVFFSPKVVELFGPPREAESPLEDHYNSVAAALQHVFEQTALHVLREVARIAGRKALCLAGGVALNSLFNGKVLEQTAFEDIWVQPASHDAGCALGGPLLYHHQYLSLPREPWSNFVYTGPSYSEAGIQEALERRGSAFKRLPDVCAEAARRLSEGQILGWFQGGSEFGPRALGNRSILADPRQADMKDIVNARVKHREAFRPFAPAVLLEQTAEYFESGYPSPHMLLIHKVRPEKREVIPAVTHVDGTGRVQTIDKAENPRFYKLIEAFQGLTRVPVVLNTSFNVRGQPIVNTPEEALEVFENVDMDALFLGNFLVERPKGLDRDVSRIPTVPD